MRIEEELKLDYSDVLFRPKRSTLQSRKDVNLKRTYRFKSLHRFDMPFIQGRGEFRNHQINSFR